jgi:hypothetical protein
LLALAVLCVAPLYWPSLSFDLFQDDYLLLRPYRPEHLWSMLTGPWIDGYTEFYRPITVLSYKAMVYLFGLNTRALHIIPFFTVTLVVWLTGVFVRRETGSTIAAATAIIIAAVHPLTTVAIGPWLSNQYQGWICVLLLLTLIAWQNCQRLHWRAWWPLWMASVLAALMKEPGLMVPLIIVGYHAARAAWLRDVRWPPWGAVASAVGLFTVLNLWRWFTLGGLGGYGTSRTPLGVFLNSLKTPYFVFVQPRADLPWSAGFAIVSIGLAALALWTLYAHRDRPESRLVLAGAVIFCAASIPTLQIMTADRAIPHQIGAILMLTGGAWTLTRLVRSRVALAAMAAVSLAVTIPLSASALQDFNPCHGRVLADRLSFEASVAPPEMLRWQALRIVPCDPATHVPFYRTTSRITWGVREEGTSAESRVHRWTTTNVRAFLDQRAVAVRIRLQHPDASPTHPIAVEVRTNRTPGVRITLTSPAWHAVTVPLTANWNVWLRQMHRLELRADASALPGLIMRPLDAIY